jgi:hypothetical protein
MKPQTKLSHLHLSSTTWKIIYEHWMKPESLPHTMFYHEPWEMKHRIWLKSQSSSHTSIHVYGSKHDRFCIDIDENTKFTSHMCHEQPWLSEIQFKLYILYSRAWVILSHDQPWLYEIWLNLYIYYVVVGNVILGLIDWSCYAPI